DEPTQGIDVGAKSEIHRLMCDLAEAGMAIIMISSELPEILGMSDRIAVMRGGTVVGLMERHEATQQKILELGLGGTDVVAHIRSAGNSMYGQLSVSRGSPAARTGVCKG